MSTQRTLAIFKPDSVANKKHGLMLQRILDEGFEVLAMRQTRLTKKEAEGFYAVHKGRPFFESLCEFMCSGPIVVLSLERTDAVAYWRQVIGATNPADAKEGTLRKLYGSSLGENAVHGSDSPENGMVESNYFFSAAELLPE